MRVTPALLRMGRFLATNPEDCHHMAELLKNVSPTQFFHVDDIQSYLSPATVDYFQTRFSLAVLDVFRDYTRLFEITQAAGPTIPTNMSIKKRRDFSVLEFFLRAFLIDGPWCSIQDVTNEHEALLAAKNCTLIEFVQNNNDFMVTHDKEWICFAPWHSKLGRPPPPQTAKFDPIVHEGYGVLKALPAHIGKFIEDGIREWMPVGKLSVLLNADALAELRASNLMTLLEFFVAHPEAYELSEDTKNVRSLRLMAHKAKLLSSLTDDTMSPCLPYVPVFWVPLSAVRTNFPDEVAKKFSELGRTNGLLHATSGVLVKNFQGKLRANGFEIVRRVTKDISPNPCLLPYTEYRIKKSFVRALDAVLSPTAFTPLQKLPDLIDAGQLRWPLDVVCSFYSSTFELCAARGVRSRRDDPDTSDTLFTVTAQFSDVVPFVKLVRSNATSKKRLARENLAKADREPMSQEEIRDEFLKILPEDDTPVLINSIRFLSKIQDLHQMVTIRGGYDKLLARFPLDFHIVPVGVKGKGVVRGYGMEKASEMNPWYDEDKMLQCVKAVIGPNGRHVATVGMCMPFQAAEVLRDYFGGPRQYFLNRPQHFSVEANHNPGKGVNVNQTDIVKLL